MNEIYVFFKEKWFLLPDIVFATVLLILTLDFLGFFKKNLFFAMISFIHRGFSIYQANFILNILRTYRMKNFNLILEDNELFLFMMKKYYFNLSSKDKKSINLLFGIFEKYYRQISRAILLRNSRSLILADPVLISYKNEEMDGIVYKNERKYLYLKTRGVIKEKSKINISFTNNTLSFRTGVEEVYKEKEDTVIKVKHINKLRILQNKLNYRKILRIPGLLHLAFAIKESRNLLFLKYTKTLFKVKDKGFNCVIENISARETYVFADKELKINKNDILNLSFTYKNNEINIIARVKGLKFEDEKNKLHLGFLESEHEGIEKIKEMIFIN